MYSSMIDTILIGRPSVVASNWKSTAHTGLGVSAVKVPTAVDVPWRFRPYLVEKGLYREGLQQPG